MQLAGEGTLFLDEVAEIPLASQAKLSEVSGRARIPLAWEAPLPNKWNAISSQPPTATLKTGYSINDFRGDLLYQTEYLYRIHSAATRERLEDIFELATQLLQQENAKYKTNKRISPRGMNLLAGLHFSWQRTRTDRNYPQGCRHVR